jgi:prefoldin subunit 5
MIKSSLAIALLIGSSIAPTLAIAANTEFYVAQDAKTHVCMVTDKKPDGKMAMDVGKKAYDSQANAQKAIVNLKVCASASTMAPAAPAGFYVAQDAKTKKCMVDDKKPDGKMMMDVGTKVYDAKGNAEQAMANLKVCASASTMAPAAPAGFYVAQDAKTKKCMVDDKKPDGKMMMDVGTKVYDAKGNAEQAMANLKICK